MNNRTKNNVLPPKKRTAKKGRPNQDKKRRKKNNSRRNANVNANARRRIETFRLSPCSTHYLKALTNPFGVEAGVACIPDLTDVPSFKCLQVNRGTFEVGTQGAGFIFASCWNPASATTFWYSDTTFALNAVPAITNAAGTLVTGNNNSTFIGAQFAAGIYQYRCVGGGLRIRYLSDELRRGGRMIPYRTYEDKAPSAVSNMTAQNFLVRPEIPSIPVDRDWAYITWLPVGPTCYDYSITPLSIPVAAIPTNCHLGFWVDGCTPGVAFEFELYCHYEIASENGQLAPVGVTPSHSDVPGMSAIRNVLETNIPSGSKPDEDFALLFDTISTWTPADMSHVVSETLKVGKAIGWI